MPEVRVLYRPQSFIMSINKNFQNIESYLHPYENWKAVQDKPRPYVFEIKRGGQNLFYFGANHSRDIRDDQYKKLEEYWRNFLDTTKGNDRIVFVEGALRQVWTDPQTSILKDSEAGFITFLASKEGIEISCPEPDAKSERDFLLTKFSNDEIQYYYFARIIPSWYKLPEPRPTFESHMNMYQMAAKKGVSEESWSGYDFSLDNMKSVHKSLFDQDFDEHDKDFILSVINPMTEKTIINKIARASSRFRDVSIVSNIVEEWQSGRDIFVVFGFAHAVLQEPALKKMLI